MKREPSHCVQFAPAGDRVDMFYGERTTATLKYIDNITLRVSYDTPTQGTVILFEPSFGMHRLLSRNSEIDSGTVVYRWLLLQLAPQVVSVVRSMSSSRQRVSIRSYTPCEQERRL